MTQGRLTLQIRRIPYEAKILHATQRTVAPIHRRRSSHTHAVYHFALVRSGKGSFELSGKAHPVKKGSLFIVSPGELHAFERLPGETTCYDEITIVLTDKSNQPLQLPFQQVLKAWSGLELKLPRFPIALEESMAESVAPKILEVSNHLQQGGALGLFRCHIALGQLLTHLTELWQVEATKPLDGFSRAKAYLDSFYHTSVSLDRLAQKVGYSYNYLSRGFKAKYGQTPMRYLRERRLKEADMLLKNTSYSLAQIADRVGISDEFYLSKLMKARHRIAPGRWRVR